MQPSEFIYSYLFNRLNARNYASTQAMYHDRHALRRKTGSLPSILETSDQNNHP